MDEPTGWAEDHIAITGIFAIGRTARYSLLGEIGSTFRCEQWGYPDWGVGMADTPTAGHEMVMLDYRACGPQGEPSVVYVDQEADYAVTLVAPDFAAFIRGLVNQEEFEDPEGELDAALTTVLRGTLSPVLRRALDAAADELPEGERTIRALAERITREKGFFALHGDASSLLMYDALFWLFSRLRLATSFEDYFGLAEGQTDYERACHVLMLRSSFVADPYDFCTAGYAERFVRDWWNARLESGAIVAVAGGFAFEPGYATQLLRVLRAVGAAG